MLDLDRLVRAFIFRRQRDPGFVRSFAPHHTTLGPSPPNECSHSRQRGAWNRDEVLMIFVIVLWSYSFENP